MRVTSSGSLLPLRWRRPSLADALALFEPPLDRWSVFDDEGFSDAEAGRERSPPSGPAEARNAYLAGYEDARRIGRVW